MAKRTRATRADGAPRRRSGPRTCFPGKEAVPVCVLLTQTGKAKLAAAKARLGISGSDVVEALLHKYSAALSRAQVGRVSTAG